MTLQADHDCDRRRAMFGVCTVCAAERIDADRAIPADAATLPHARRSDPRTSQASAAASAPTVGGKAARLLTEIARAGALTAREAGERAGMDAHGGPWKRVSDLHRLGLIESRGEKLDEATGRDVTVYGPTPAGLAWCEEAGTLAQQALPIDGDYDPGA